MRKGLTVAELLIAVLITIILLTVIYSSYFKLVKSTTQESSSIKTQLETLTGIELLRLDLEHAGYGIARDEPSNIIEWDNSTKSLIIRSVLNNTNKVTQSWALVDCSSGIPLIAASGGNLSPSTHVVYLTTNRTFVANGTLSSCPTNDILMAFPYSPGTSGCSKQFCYKITYKVSSDQPLQTCNPYTHNLLRAVGTSNGYPVIDCIADFVTTFDYDSNGDGILSSSERNQLLSTFSCNSTDCSRLKQINIYLLVQEGREDPEFFFNGNTTIDNITLQLPPDYVHYRWEIIKLTVVPMELK